MSSKQVENIMVIESEPVIRQEMAAALDNDVFVVTEVSDYFEALWHMNEVRPDLVIIDENLPMMNGWEACRCLSETFRIPTIMLGCDADSRAWTKTLEAGADFYLRAPVSPMVLCARVKAILRRYKKEAATI
ncbi:MAG: response regulator [Dehalococcoidales bacterium]|nr:response regulator [Dehalococcoidales bacterium]